MRDRLLADWPLKALALVIAFVIWASIIGQDRTVKDFAVPLEIDFGVERIAGGPTPTVVTVRLEGPRSTLRRVDALRLAAKLDLHDAPTGDREFPLSKSHLTGVPPGLAVSRFVPDRVRLVVARRARREIEVAPELVGALPATHALYGYSVDPPTVVVEGPEEVVEGLKEIHTEPIPLDDRTEAWVEAVGLVSDGPEVRVVDVEHVNVRLDIETAPVEMTFEGIAVALPFVPAGEPTLRPSTVTVSLTGPQWLLEQVDPGTLSALAEVDALGPRRIDQARLRIDLNLPPARQSLVTVKSVKPTHVSVRLPASPAENS